MKNRANSVIPYFIAVVILIGTGFASTSTGTGVFNWAITIAQSFAGWPLMALCLVSIASIGFFLLSYKSRGWPWILPPLALSLYSLVSILGPVQKGVKAPEIAAPGMPDQIRILHANLYLYNSRETMPSVLATIRHWNPDIIILHELDVPHHAVLGSQLSDYTYQRIDTTHPYFGSGIYSRVPLKNVKEISTRIETLVSFDLELYQSQGAYRHCNAPSRMSVITVHPVAPFNPRILEIHRRALKHLAESANQKDAVLVTGDFNSVDWSADMQHLQESTGLKKVFSASFTENLFRGTYSAQWPNLFRLPIDGILVSNDLNVSGFKKIEIPGSDHLGLVVDVQWPSPENCDSLKNFQRSSP